ncbi:MAG: ATP-dependent helicase, partial [Bacteroidia bacterium]
VLVDEFQDTSGTQIDLLHHLIDYWESPNIFVVGDDDQSIYRFQGANVENIIHFSSKYSSRHRSILLTQNYRSSQNILDAAKTSIDHNDPEKRISKNKTLVASNPDFASIKILPEVRAYYNPSHEAVGTAMEIERLHDSGTNWNEMAVIYRNHEQAEEIIRYLQSKRIPVNAKKRINIFDELLIRKLITILRFIDAEKSKPDSGEPYLFEMMHFREFQITPAEIANISFRLNQRSQGKSRDEQTWRGFLKDIRSKKQPDLFTSNATLPFIEKFAQLTDELITDSSNCTLQQLIENILTKCGLLADALTSEDRSWNLELLNTFFDFVKNECSKNSRTNLHPILELILLMQDNGVQLPAEKITYAENGVNFITAHSSKGLEFDTVFIMGCLKDKWDKTSGGGNNFKLPDNLFEEKGDETEEARRLFYVAMTRAKKQLVISFPERDHVSKELERSRFVAELEEGGKVSLVQIQLADEDLIDFTIRVLQSGETKISDHELINKEFLDPLLQGYSLSVTHLNNFLACPVSFYFENLLRVPAPKSASMTFGSAVHYVLECLFKNMNANEQKVFGTVEDFLSDFTWYMHRHADAFTTIEFQNRVEYAKKILPEYYRKYISEWNKITSIERSYRNVVVDGIPLNGKLDKLEFDGIYVNVVDYKTGQFKNAQRKLNRPNEEKVSKSISQNKKPNPVDLIGGDYWRQAVFYKILMDNDPTKNWKMRSTEFDFIEPDKETKEFVKAKVEITTEDEKIVLQQIKKTFASILNMEFTNGCNDPGCRWCNFVNDYYARNSLKS